MNAPRTESIIRKRGEIRDHALYELARELEDDNARLREREKMCETMDKAEKLALIHALQEIRDAVGLLGDGV